MRQRVDEEPSLVVLHAKVGKAPWSGGLAFAFHAVRFRLHGIFQPRREHGFVSSTLAGFDSGLFHS